MKTQNLESQSSLTSKQALDILIQGNQRFQQNIREERNFPEQVKQTKEGQFPFAAILSCIDSRVSSELIFDQGIGDIFSARVAGNFINDDILGSLEYACRVAGSKLIVVLGHTKCGAVTAACGGACDGYIEKMLENIRPAVELARADSSVDSSSENFPDIAAKVNVQVNIENIRQQSKDLRELEASGKIQIIGGIYDVSTGAVAFFS